VAFDFVSFLLFLLIAAICGAIAEAILGYSPGGLLMSIGAGLVGAYIGQWLAMTLSVTPLIPVRVGDAQIDLIFTVFGAIIFLVFVGALRGRWR
jgi:uncharacterized membrane protein YeaQ/YmgE (transglycosylase-associated protein family)